MSDMDNIVAAMPNAQVNQERRSLADQIKLISQTYIPRSMQSIFATDRPELYMQEVKEGYTYAWPKRDKFLNAKVRSGDYRIVDPSELREDCPLAIETKQIPGMPPGEEYVTLGDLVLVEVNPEATDRLYKSRAVEGLLNAHGNIGFSNFQDNVAEVISKESLEDGSVTVKATEYKQSKG